jgi:hypothetical protein
MLGSAARYFVFVNAVQRLILDQNRYAVPRQVALQNADLLAGQSRRRRHAREKQTAA